MERAAGSEIGARSQLQLGLLVDANDLLHRALAHGWHAQYQAAVPVLDGAGDDLRSTGRGLVYQHDQGLAGHHGVFLGQEPGGILVGAAGVEDHELVLAQEEIRHFHGLGQVASAVVLKVEDEPLHSPGLEVLQRLPQFAAGALLKALQLDVSGGIGEEGMVGHAVHAHFFALDGQVEGFGDAGAAEREGRGGAGLAAHQVGRVAGGHVLGGAVVDGDDEITRPDPGPRRRGIIVQEGPHRNGAVRVDHLDLEPEAAVVALGADVEIVQIALLHEDRVGIEDPHHPGDSEAHQGIGADAIEGLLVDGPGDIQEGLERVSVAAPEGVARSRVEGVEQAFDPGAHQAVGRDLLEVISVNVLGYGPEELAELPLQLRSGGFGLQGLIHEDDQGEDEELDESRHGVFPVRARGARQLPAAAFRGDAEDPGRTAAASRGLLDQSLNAILRYSGILREYS